MNSRIMRWLERGVTFDGRQGDLIGPPHYSKMKNRIVMRIVVTFKERGLVRQGKDHNDMHVIPMGTSKQRRNAETSGRFQDSNAHLVTSAAELSEHATVRTRA